MKTFTAMILLLTLLVACKFFETPEAKTLEQDFIKAADVACVMGAESIDVNELAPLCGITKILANFLLVQKFAGADRVASKRGGFKNAYEVNGTYKH